MQTFLPYDSVSDSAKCLDRQRLGKQRVEVLQIFRALAGKSKGWTNHPATKMWRDCELALKGYGIEVCQEWMARGYRDTCLEQIVEIADVYFGHQDFRLPFWLGREEFHSAHRAVLLAKNPAWYGKFGWKEKPAVPDEKGSFKDTYVWPV